jgi:hypothetical protein
MNAEHELSDLHMDPGALYREDVYTDRRVGSVRRLTPVGHDGAPDPGRQVLFEGQTTLLTSAGPLPLRFEIEAESLAQALERFGAAAESALEQTLKDLEEMRRQAASPLIVPGRGPLGLGDLGGGGGPRITRP